MIKKKKMRKNKTAFKKMNLGLPFSSPKKKKKKKKKNASRDSLLFACLLKKDVNGVRGNIIFVLLRASIVGSKVLINCLEWCSCGRLCCHSWCNLHMFFLKTWLCISVDTPRMNSTYTKRFCLKRHETHPGHQK